MTASQEPKRTRGPLPYDHPDSAYMAFCANELAWIGTGRISIHLEVPTCSSDVVEVVAQESQISPHQF
ncbi:hypothetical protein CEXT_745241 [Caerostris extrusa]|uniref:Uncharacterized protein n=1 Tax=Caerostris extrusa TaxID=172846 RepID=A0AAV4R6S2_CAEEX|nr:hypothetical protein CEXT_745241 [Caerostris extrusa]